MNRNWLTITDPLIVSRFCTATELSLGTGVIYKEEKLELRRKGKKRFKNELRGQLESPTSPIQLWTMDFVSDALCDGRNFRTLNLVNAFTRQCLSIETDTSLIGYLPPDLWAWAHKQLNSLAYVGIPMG